MYKEKRSMTLTSSGDSLMVKRLPQDYSELKPLADFINSAEARLTNLECVIINRDCYASAYSGGTWVGTEKATLTELQKFGFNFFGCANNHSLDYSYDGLLNTVKVLEDADVAYAGIGRTLY
nr:CapA family protein [Clostridia bacterium]